MIAYKMIEKDKRNLKAEKKKIRNKKIIIIMKIKNREVEKKIPEENKDKILKAEVEKEREIEKKIDVD